MNFNVKRVNHSMDSERTAGCLIIADYKGSNKGVGGGRRDRGFYDACRTGTDEKCFFLRRSQRCV